MLTTIPKQAEPADHTHNEVILRLHEQKKSQYLSDIREEVEKCTRLVWEPSEHSDTDMLLNEIRKELLLLLRLQLQM